VDKFFTSESVTEGHPDKLCDLISDAVLDAVLEKDPAGRVACECAATRGMVLVTGEISTDNYVDIAGIARKTIEEAGYNSPAAGFDGRTCAVLTAIDEQSPDIALGVTGSMEVKNGSDDSFDLLGAGDQGMVFGYACNETEELMPMPIMLAHELAYTLTKARKSGKLPFLLPDGKTQVTVRYGADGKPNGIDTVVISAQHMQGYEHSYVQEAIYEEVFRKVVNPNNLGDRANWRRPHSLDDIKVLINPTGRFTIGGPTADAGLTGRKIIVDTYGGYARHGGGAFSGKDPTKVDRSAAYMARYIAKNLVFARFAEKCEVQIAYAIGVAQPVSVRVDTFGTGALDDDKIADIVNQLFDMRPSAIIAKLDLRRPIYKNTAAYGHFGNVARLNNRPWEQTDRYRALRDMIPRG